MAKTSIGDILTSQDPEELSKLARQLGSEIVDRLSAVVPKARRGNPAAVRSYVRCWRELEDRLLAAFHEASPDIVVRTEEGALLVADIKGRPSDHLTEVLDQEALNAPFSVWVQAVGDGSGIAVHMIAAVRRFTGQSPVQVPEHLLSPLLFLETSRSLEPARFLRLAYRELEADRDPLDRVADIFRLTDTDVARLFAVSRQRIAQWREDGVPVSHQPKLNAIARIADALERNLMPDRIPGIVRTAASAFGKRTLLEQIERDHHEDALRRVEDSFDWAKTA